MISFSNLLHIRTCVQIVTAQPLTEVRTQAPNIWTASRPYRTLLSFLFKKENNLWKYFAAFFPLANNEGGTKFSFTFSCVSRHTMDKRLRLHNGNQSKLASVHWPVLLSDMRRVACYIWDTFYLYYRLANSRAIKQTDPENDREILFKGRAAKLPNMHEVIYKRVCAHTFPIFFVDWGEINVSLLRKSLRQEKETHKKWP